MADYRIDIKNPVGDTTYINTNRFEQIEYRRAANSVGVCRVILPFDTDIDLLTVDNRIEIYRDGDLVTNTIFFLRQREKQLDENGLERVVITGYSALDLLRRHIIAYAAGSSQASKSGNADDVIKAIIRENLGSSATDTGRDLSAYLTVASDNSLGVSVEKAFSRRNVLTVCQELAQASAEGGTPLYFDVVKSGADLLFQTVINQPGNDLSSLVLAPETGALVNITQGLDRQNEITYAYAGGQGVGESRQVGTANDSTRLNASVFNRMEGWYDARHLTSAASLTDAAEGMVRDGRPVDIFDAEIKDTEGIKYGRDWNYGDRLTASFEGTSQEVVIESLEVTVQNGRETIRAGMRAV